MIFDLRLPSGLTNHFKTDIAGLSVTLRALITTLRKGLQNLDDHNITSLSASKLIGEIDSSKLTGGIDSSKIFLSGGCLETGDNYFKLSNADGSQYILLQNGRLSVKANIITEDNSNV